MRTARLCTWQWCRRVTERSTARGEAVACPVAEAICETAALLCFRATLPYTRCAVRMQRLEPFVALLLIRQRPTHTAGGGQHWALGAAVTSLPSGVLAMVLEAMMKLESKLDVRPGS